MPDLVPSVLRGARVHVAGHAGLVGSALMRRLAGEGCATVLTASRAELDLRDPVATRAWYLREKPDAVFVAAATVGGIQANATRPVEFLSDNLLIAASVLGAAHAAGSRKVVYLGSSCIYPRECPQPMSEEHLLTGPLEPTNEAYAVAKIAGVKLCSAYRKQYGRDFVSLMPTNLYGPGDNFDLESAHVLPALMRRFHEAGRDGAREVTVWGTGTPRREFLHVDDLADACVFAMKGWSGDGPLNVGTGEELTIGNLAAKIRDLVAPGVAIRFDPSRPDGTPRKLLDVSKIRALGWRHRIGLDEGLRSAYDWYRMHADTARKGR